jgi:hypothetical protein
MKHRLHFFFIFSQGGIAQNVVPNKFVVGKQHFHFLAALSYTQLHVFSRLLYRFVFVG